MAVIRTYVTVLLLSYIIWLVVALTSIVASLSETNTLVLFILLSLSAFFCLSIYNPLDGAAVDFAYYALAIIGVVVLVAGSANVRRHDDLQAKFGKLTEQISSLELNLEYTTRYRNFDDAFVSILNARKDVFGRELAAHGCRGIYRLSELSVKSKRAEDLRLSSPSEGGNMWVASPCGSIAKALDADHSSFQAIVQDWLTIEGRIAWEFMWPANLSKFLRLSSIWIRSR